MRDLIVSKRICPAVLAVGAVLLALLVVVPMLTLHRAGANAAPAQASPSPSASPMPVPSGAVTLVAGARSVYGVEVGYPRTVVGAVSAAADYLDAVASTLDPDYAASVMRVAGDPANAQLTADLAHSTVALRADLDLPTTGPLAPPVSFQTIAEMYQVRDATTDNILVLLLTDSTFVNARGGMAQTTGVFPVQMRWAADDWKLAAVGGGTDYSGLAANPDTSAAAAQGWLTLVAAQGGAS